MCVVDRVRLRMIVSGSPIDAFLRYLPTVCLLFHAVMSSTSASSRGALVKEKGPGKPKKPYPLSVELLRLSRPKTTAESDIVQTPSTTLVLPPHRLNFPEDTLEVLPVRLLCCLPATQDVPRPDWEVRSCSIHSSSRDTSPRCRQGSHADQQGPQHAPCPVKVRQDRWQVPGEAANPEESPLTVSLGLQALSREHMLVYLQACCAKCTLHSLL